MGEEKEMATDKKQVDRRVFLKGALATGAGLALAGCTTQQSPAPAAAPTAAPAAPAAAAAKAPAAAPAVVATREPVQVVRFVFAPDPVWDYMKDTGILATYEDKYNVKVVNTTTPDEVAWFVGGHADIASLASYEIPVVAKNTGRDFTAFAKYNVGRTSLTVKADSPYHSLADLKGKKISVIGPGSNTMSLGAMFQKMYNLDYRIGGGDFNLFVQEYAAMPPMLLKGEVDCICCEPEKQIPYFVKGQIRYLDDKLQTIWEIYRDNFDPAKKFKGLATNTFVAQTDYFNKNPKVIQFFLDMWQEGLDAWQKNREDIIKSYPQHFSIENDDEVAYLVKWMNDGHDWFVDKIALDDDWIKQELASLNLFRETGRFDKTAPDPKFVAVKIAARS
jgi:ABC-type nitrate/sulfonate/bicarbonate transport system substrate-binding protein